MGQNVPDPGGSASMYQYYLALLSWLGLGRPGWAPWLFAAVTVTGLLLSLAPMLRAVLLLVRYVRGWWTGRRDPRRVRRRGLFADHLESQLRRLDEKEEWRDHRFARLEAEVEMEGGQRHLLPRWPYRANTSLRRVKSLSRALQRSSERLIILQGEPGSGKSVALRNAARALAVRGMRHPTSGGRLPLYVNLKEFRPVDGRLDSETVRAFVWDQLNRANSRDVEEFLSDGFAMGMRDGTWLFLFDSFDEIPEILTATELDETVGRYADVLYDFLHGMNTSPGVIASREFKGPRRVGWPRFTVQRLTERQKRELIRKADLAPAAEAEVYAALSSADPMVTRLSENPMLLGLLCEHVRTTGSFPVSSHTVFETFVHSRLQRDRERVLRRYGVDPGELRQVAEEIAFRLMAASGAGLSPSRAEVAHLLAGLEIGGQPVDRARLDRYLDALEYVKLGQAPEGTGSGDRRGFTFAHRRFQEYFATCVVIREPHRVPTRVLLLDGRWRETAVAMVQTQRGEAVTALVAEAGRILARGVEAAGLTVDGNELAPDLDRPEFHWPAHSLHLIDLLDAGLAGRPQEVPEDLRTTVTTLLRAAWASGHRHHQLWAVQGSLLAEPASAERLLEDSFSSKSMLLRGAAYRYAGRLPTVSPQLGGHLRRALIDQSAQGRLLFDWPTVRAQLSRLGTPEAQLRAGRLLRWHLPLTGLLITIFFVAGAGVQGVGDRTPWAAGWLTTMSLIGMFVAVDMLMTRLQARNRIGVAWSTDAVVHAMWRTVSVFIGLGVAVSDAPPVDSHWFPALVFLWALGYTVCWPVAAVTAVAWGVDVRPWRWPLLPLLVVPPAGRLFLGMRWRQRAGAVLRVAGIGAVFPTVAVSYAWLAAQHPGAGTAVTAVSYLIAGVLLLLLVGDHLIKVRADRRRLRSIAPTRVLDAAALAEVIRSLRSDHGLRQLVRLIRRQRIDCDQNCMAVLADLTMNARRHWLSRAAGRPIWRKCLDNARLSRGRPATGNISEGTLDEVTRLIAERSDPGPGSAARIFGVVRQRDGDDEVRDSPARPAG